MKNRLPTDSHPQIPENSHPQIVEALPRAQARVPKENGVRFNRFFTSGHGEGPDDLAPRHLVRRSGQMLKGVKRLRPDWPSLTPPELVDEVHWRIKKVLKDLPHHPLGDSRQRRGA